MNCKHRSLGVSCGHHELRCTELRFRVVSVNTQSRSGMWWAWSIPSLEMTIN